MKSWAQMATDIWLVVMGAAALGGTPSLIIFEDGIGFGIDFNNSPKSTGYGYSLN